MSQVIVHKDFKSLRQAYLEIKQFLEDQSGDDVLSLQTKIENDLGLAGDDNLELLELFVKKYQLDARGFDYSKHFLSEGELFNSGATLWALLSIPLFLLFWTIKFLTFGKLDLMKFKFWPDEDHYKADLTFGDMLTWYLTGKYKLRNEVKFICN